MIPLRCPRHPRTKFAEVDGDYGTVEVSCRPCRRDLASIGGTQGQVIHAFTLDGDCTETRITLDGVPVQMPDSSAS